MTQDPAAGVPQPHDHGLPPPPGTGGGQQPASSAGLGARIGARLLDILLVAVPVSIVLTLLGFGTAELGAEGWASSALLSALWFGYFVWLESSSGATLGKRLLSMRVVAIGGGHPSTASAAKRNVWMLFGLVPIVGGLLSLIAIIVIIVTIASNADRRGYHDVIAGTTVLR